MNKKNVHSSSNKRQTKSNPIDVLKGQKFLDILDNIPVAIFIKDLKGHFIAWNKKCEEFNQIKKAKILGKTDYDLYSKKVADLFRTNDKKVIRTGKIQEFEEISKERVGLSIKTLLFDKDKKPYALLGILTDITKRKKALEALAESEEKFRSITESANDAIISSNSKGQIISWNSGAKKIFGYDEKEIIGKQITTLMPNSLKPLHSKAFKNRVSGNKKVQKTIIGKVVEMKGIKKNGEVVPVDISVSSWKGNAGQIFFTAIIRDISEHTLLHEKIKKERELAERRAAELEATIRSVADGIAVYDLNGNIITMNPSALRIFGYSKKDFEKPVVQRLKMLNARTPQGKPFKTGDFPIYRALKGKIINDLEMIFKRNNQDIWVVVSAAPVKMPDGQMIGAVIIYRNVTDIKIAQEKLKREKEFSERLITNISDGIFAFDKKCRYTLWNNGMEKITGLKKEEILGKVAFNVFPFLKEVGEDYSFYKALSGKNAVTKDSEYTISQTGKQGFFDASYSPLFGDNGEVTGGFAVIHDVTERKELEKRKDEFMSIASHELKTPITTVKVFAQIIRKIINKQKNKNLNYYLTKMNDQIDKMTELIGDLLDVSKIQAGKLELRKENFDLNELIKDTIKSMQKMTKIKIEINGWIDNKIFADRHRIGQVLINLINNAIKYSPDGNKIIVQILPRSDKVTIGIEDFGIGIEEKHKAKIFDRFFQITTEPSASSGLGMGLYISSEIVKRHKGKIWVESKKDKGSIFYFTIPFPSQLPLE